MSQSLQTLFSLEGRTALVTGGNGGVGAMLARGLLMGGARVIVSGRDGEKGRQAAEDLSRIGPCEFIRADLADRNELAGFVERVTEIAPGLDILVNNAGINERSSLGECGAEEFDRALSLNVTVPFLLVESLHPLLKRNATLKRPAHIVNTGSIAALTTASPSFSYGPSKAALHHLTRILARQLAPDHIRVNAIAPGLFASGMTAELMDDEDRRNAAAGRSPVPRIGEADDLASVIVAIISNSYMTGAVIPVDGGLSL